MTEPDDVYPVLGIDLGLEHRMSWWQHRGREHAGIFVGHSVRDDDKQCKWHSSVPGMCIGSVAFDVPENDNLARERWEVESWDPLTLSPSLLCHCGDHGFIREGRWVAA